MKTGIAERLYGKGHADAGKKCHHLHEHRLSCREYQDLRDRACEACEICGTSEEKVYRQLLHIDHDHVTGRARGLLCAKCNAVMACYDGRKTWGANRRWEEQAIVYVAMASLWSAYIRVTARLRSDPFRDMADHVRAVITERGTDHDRAELAAAEEELTERRSRKGGRPSKTRDAPPASEES